MALVATVGGATADSYVTVAAADAHFDTRLNVTAWTGASTADKERALKTATREIDLSAFQGSPTDTVQALAWPRAYAPNPDPSGLAESDYLDDATIPERVALATYELALAHLNAGTSDLSLADAGGGIIRKKVGPLETEWASGSSRASGWSRFPLVADALRPLLAGGAGATWERR